MMPRKVRRLPDIDQIYLSETKSETARDGTKNFDQIYSYIQDVAKREFVLSRLSCLLLTTRAGAMNPNIRPEITKVIEETLREITE